MQPLTHENLGVTIAYILPGFLILWGLSPLSPTITSWLSASAGTNPTVGGFLYVLLCSLSLGILANFVRSLAIDPIHRRTGIPQRAWNYEALQTHLEAVNFMVLHQFRYYQFAGNTIVALIFTSAMSETFVSGWQWTYSVWAAIVTVILWVGGRTNLRAYYQRLEDVLGKPAETTSGSWTFAWLR